MIQTELVEEKELWRALTAVYTHANLLHLIFNMMSLWNLNFIEIQVSCALRLDFAHLVHQLGVVVYLKYTYFLIVLSELLITAFHWIMIHQFERDTYRIQSAVGYSGYFFQLKGDV
jgi:membrane associated rhomboid family serine protease